MDAEPSGINRPSGLNDQLRLAAFEQRYVGFPFRSCLFWNVAILVLGINLPLTLILSRNDADRKPWYQIAFSHALVFILLTLYTFTTTRLQRHGVNAEGTIVHKKKVEGNRIIPEQYFIQYSYTIEGSPLYTNEKSWFEVNQAIFEDESAVVPIKYLSRNPGHSLPRMTLYYRDLWIFRFEKTLLRFVILLSLIVGYAVFSKWFLEDLIGWKVDEGCGYFLIQVLAGSCVFATYSIRDWYQHRQEHFHTVAPHHTVMEGSQGDGEVEVV